MQYLEMRWCKFDRFEGLHLDLSHFIENNYYIHLKFKYIPFLQLMALFL